MKFFEINQFPNLTQLNEANVLNAKGDNGSIQSYIAGYVDNIGSGTAKRMFTKKLAKLFINDEHYHQTVRDLPDGAPDWAGEAMSRGELVKFLPTPDLNTKMEHLTHYLDAVVRDTKSENNNTAVHANKELAGFSKAESVEVLVKKSNEYFKRGSKAAAKRSSEGMKEIMKASNGFSWYLLETVEAYRLTGKILQNCIGSFWSHSKAKKQNMSIVVLKTGNGEMVVAARISNGDHAIVEMKGKNNKPPINKYMPPVLEFLRKMKLPLQSNAVNDFSNAGYYYIDDYLYDRKEAVAKFIKSIPVGEIQGKKITKSVTSSDSEAMRTLFNQIYSKAGLHKHRSNVGISIYEMFGKAKNIIGSVKDHILEIVTSNDLQSGVVTESGELDSDIQLFVEFLYDKHIINDVSSKLHKQFLWDHGVTFDTESRKMTPVTPHSTVDHGKHKFDIHKGSAKHSYIQSVVSDRFGDKLRNTDAYDEVRLSKPPQFDKNNTLAMAHHKDSKTIEVSSHDVDGTKSYGEAHADGSNIQYHDIVDSVVDYANQVKGKLSHEQKYSMGVVTDKDGKYSKYQPKFNEHPGGSKADLSDIHPDEIGSALTAIGKSKNVRSRGATDEQLADPYFVHSDDILDLRSNQIASMDGNRSTNYRSIPTTPEQKIKSKMGGHLPDSVYKVKVDYGTERDHEVLLVTSNDKIVKMDTSTDQHEFQQWDDYEKVADQLNKFAEDNKLAFMPKAVNNRKEFRVIRGKLSTASALQQERLDRMKSSGQIGNEATSELPFEDGHKLTRMDQSDQVNWMRKELGATNHSGEAWKLADPTGATKAVYTVKNGVVNAAHGISTYSKKVNDKRTSSQHNKYLKSAMDQFDWKVNHKSPQFHMKPNSMAANAVKRVDDKPNHTRQSVSTPYQDAINQGLIRRMQKRFTLTGLGRQAINDFNDYKNHAALNSDSVDHTRAKIHPEFVMPDKVVPKAKVKAPTPVGGQTHSGVTRTGTKASQALDLFKAHVSDHDEIPSRKDFMTILKAPPFNMSNAGASTYYANTKKKYAALNEKYSMLAAWEIMLEEHDRVNRADDTFMEYLVRESM